MPSRARLDNSGDYGSNIAFFALDGPDLDEVPRRRKRHKNYLAFMPPQTLPAINNFLDFDFECRGGRQGDDGQISFCGTILLHVEQAEFAHTKVPMDFRTHEVSQDFIIGILGQLFAVDFQFLFRLLLPYRNLLGGQGRS